MKKTAIIGIFLIFILVFSGCNSEERMENCPDRFSGSTWSSDDGRVQFTVDGNHCIGTINVDGESVDVYYCIDGVGNIDVYPIEAYQKALETGVKSHSDIIEEWGGDFYSNTEFKVHVAETTYFTEGEEFIVKRVS